MYINQCYMFGFISFVGNIRYWTAFLFPDRTAFINIFSMHGNMLQNVHPATVVNISPCNFLPHRKHRLIESSRDKFEFMQDGSGFYPCNTKTKRWSSVRFDIIEPLIVKCQRCKSDSAETGACDT